MKDEELVICEKSSDECPDYCIHKTKHKKDCDLYFDKNEPDYCTSKKSQCGYRNDEPFCKCIPTNA